jgi:hypothetical protein
MAETVVTAGIDVSKEWLDCAVCAARTRAFEAWAEVSGIAPLAA